MKRIVGLYIAWLIAATLLAAAVTQRQPYNFYVFLRWVCCAVFAISAFTANEQHRKIWFWIFVVLAVLFNPIVPVHLQRDTWQILDSGAVVVMVIAAIFFWYNHVDGRTARGATATPTGETRQANKIETVPRSPNGNAAKPEASCTMRASK
jgi:FtsH-binding integral membrane protein